MKAVFKKEKGNIKVNVGILMSITASAAIKKKNSRRRTIKMFLQLEKLAV